MSNFPPHIDATMIRQYADGELTPNQRLEIERALEQTPELRRALAFEKELKTRVTTVMRNTSPAPLALRQQIVSALREEPETANADAILANISPDPTKDASMVSSRQRFTRPNFFAVAASLALVAGAILFGIYGPPIDQWHGGNTAGIAPITEISEFVTRAHDQAQFSQSWGETVGGGTCQESCNKISKQLGCQKKILSIDLSELGYQYRTDRMIDVPHYKKSAQLVFYRNEPGRSKAMCSVFIGYNRMIESEKVVEPGNWTKMPLNDSCTHAVYLSSDGSIDYLLVCCDPADMDRVAEAIGQQLVASCSGVPAPPAMAAPPAK